MKKLILSLVVCSAFLPVAGFGQAASNDPFVGTWNLNVAKSKISPGPAPTSETVTISPEGKVAVHEAFLQGKDLDWSYTAVEGGPAPIEGWPEGSTVTTKRTGNVMQHIWKQGTGTETGHAVVSKDGKTMTYTMRGTNSKG